MKENKLWSSGLTQLRPSVPGQKKKGKNLCAKRCVENCNHLGYCEAPVGVYQGAGASHRTQQLFLIQSTPGGGIHVVVCMRSASDH